MFESAWGPVPLFASVRRICSIDNAACERICGHQKNELFFTWYWLATTIEQFMKGVDRTFANITKTDQDIL